jgi:bacterioferritin-associated ferredoxin
MLLCHCRAVSDREVRAAHDEGAHTLAAVSLRCGAGRDCGGCRGALRQLLDELDGRSAPSEHAHAHTASLVTAASGA